MSDSAETGGSTSTSTGVRGVPPPAPVPSSSSVRAPGNAGQDASLVQSTSITDPGGLAGAESTGPPAASPNEASSSAPTAGRESLSPSGAPSSNSSSASKPGNPGWPFNSTIAFTVNWTSPMISTWESDFKVDPVTGARVLNGDDIREMYNLNLNFVGVGYGMNGTARWRSDSLQGDSPIGERDVRSRGPQLTSILRDSLMPDSPNLSATNDLDLRPYEVQVRFRGLIHVDLYNATIHLPIKTQAPNFTAMLSQAKTVPTIVAQNHGGFVTDVISPFMDLSTCSVLEELGRMDRIPSRNALDSPIRGPVVDFLDGHVALRNTSEIFYTIPPNTTLVEVLGPSGTSPKWMGSAECYAFLNPRPSWWKESSFPLSSSQKIVNSTDQTMFLLPIDPEIQYEVRVGAFGNTTSCPISAIRTYPFHYNFAADQANATDLSTNTTTSNTTDSSTTTAASAVANGSKTNTTPIIVGVVVGVGGGLVLLGLAFWLFRRRKKQIKEKEKELLPNPYAPGPVREPRTKQELAQMARGEGLGRAPSSPPSEGSTEEQAAEPRRRRGRRIVQEEDGESIVEYLPPQYSEAWQAGQEPGQSAPAVPDDSPGPSSGSGSRPLAAPATPPAVQDPALEDKVRALNADRPQLKQEYTRAFGRALPVPPHSTPTPDPAEGSQSGTDALPSGRAQSESTGGDLRAEYKRRFGSRAHSSSGQESHASSGDLRADYKRQFGFETPSSQAGARPSLGTTRPESHAVPAGDDPLDMREEYKRWFS